MDDLDRLFRRLVHNIRNSYPEYLSRPFEVAELYQNLVPYRHNRRELEIETNQDYEVALCQLLAGERAYVSGDSAMQEAMQRELGAPHPDAGVFRQFATARVQLAPDALLRYEQMTMAAPGGLPPRTSNAGSGAAHPVPQSGQQQQVSQQQPAAPQQRPTQSAQPPTHPAAQPSSQLAPAPQQQSRPASPPPQQPAVQRPPGTAGQGGTQQSQQSQQSQPSQPSQQAPRPVAPAQTPAGAPTVASGAAAAQCRYCGGNLPTGRAIVFCAHCGQNLTVQRCPACQTELELGWKFCVTCGRGVK